MAGLDKNALVEEIVRDAKIERSEARMAVDIAYHAVDDCLQRLRSLCDNAPHPVDSYALTIALKLIHANVALALQINLVSSGTGIPPEFVARMMGVLGNED